MITYLGPNIPSLNPKFVGAGHFCPLPFVSNGQYFDHCTRKSHNGISNELEDKYWCPSPFNITFDTDLYFQAAVFSSGGERGFCTDYSIPPGEEILIAIVIPCNFLIYIYIH